MTRTAAHFYIAALLLAGASAAAPAAALDASRSDVRDFVNRVGRRDGLDPAWVADTIAKAQSQPRIIDLMSRPAERVKPWHEYRDHFLTEERIAAGVRFWTEHRDLLDAVSRYSGVSPSVIVGILGVETYFGRITGNFRVLDALATLAFDYPPRASYFRSELEQFLLLSREEDLPPESLRGSYAGAMGYPQFMPRSFRAFAVDGDGDGRRDLWSNWHDVVASIANYLVSHGWRAGEPVTAPAELWDADADGLVAGSLDLDDTVQGLRDKGVEFNTTLPGDAPALFIDVAGDGGPELRVGFHNFSVITRYNHSVLYALAVTDLGRAVESRLPAEGGS